MNKRYEGKTKTVYELSDGTYMLYFKDNVTGKDGVFDPGANSADLIVDQNGYFGLKLSKHLFEMLESRGVHTHYLSADVDARTMQVKPVTFFGQGIEVICRRVATGSFIRRYGAYAKEGDELTYFVEISLKDDEREDPFITQELLEQFGVLAEGEYDILLQQTVEITKILEEILGEKQITLMDLKLEFGKDAGGGIILIDELSGGNMRTTRNGELLLPIELCKVIV